MTYSIGLTSWMGRWFGSIIAPNATREQAHTELATIGDRAAADFPETNARLRVRVLPYTHSLDGVRGVTLL